MKALVLYFSGSGNTAFVAKRIAAVLKSLEVDAELHSTEESFAAKPDSFDLLILGCPKYYEYPVLDFIGYIKKCVPPSRRPIPAMLFVTQAGTLVTDWRGPVQILLKKGYRPTVGKSFPIANNLTIFRFFPLTNKTQIEENLQKLEAELPPLLRRFIVGEGCIERTGRILGTLEKAVAYLCTGLFPVFLIRFSASAACTGCGLCAKCCPKGNIRLVSERPVFGHSCLFCMRCISGCPANAILYHKKQCTQYNTRLLRP
jgi:flavodoxin/ferredoxin